MQPYHRIPLLELTHLRVELADRTVGGARDHAAAFLHSLPRPLSPGPTAPADVLLVVSELVTNALRHAPGPAALHLVHQPGEVEVTVQDSSPHPPTARGGGLEHGTGGFGWPTVQHLATRVQVQVHGAGKSVRAFLAW